MRALFGQRGHIGDQGHAGVLGNSQQLELAALHMGIGRQHAVHQHLGLAGDGVLYRLHSALVGHVHPFRAGDAGQFHAGQMGSAARGRHGEIQVLLLGQCHQLCQIVRRHRGVHHQHMGRVGQHGRAAQGDGGVEAELGVDRRRDRQGAQIAQQPGVAVGRRAGHKFRPQIAVGSGLVLDHDGLLQLLRDQLSDGAGNDVGAASGGIGHDQANRLAGPGVTREHRRGKQTDAGEGQR
ncbi:hypothetical protein D3C78_1164930 [compost metagenome]